MKPLAIMGCGAVTAVGYTAVQTCAAVRTAITGFMRSDRRSAVRGPLLEAEVPLTPRPHEADQLGRLVALATVGLRECLEATQLNPSDCLLLLSVREPFRAGPATDWDERTLLAGIQEAGRFRFHPLSEVLPHGNAGAMVALVRAEEQLRAGRVTACIIGGVDSLLNMVDRRRLAGTYRLKSAAVAQGLVPGEGSAFVALTTDTGSGLCSIAGAGVAQEPAQTSAAGAGDPTGKGLEEAVRRAIAASAPLSEPDIVFRVSDMNGETYGAIESMLASSRVFRTRREKFPQILPASSVGEIGAAAGPLLLIVGATALHRGYAPGRVGVCEMSSEGGLRGACVITGAELMPRGA